MTRLFFTIAISTLFFIHTQAQAISEEKKMLKEIIRLRESFVAAGFAENSVLKKDISWTSFACEAPPASTSVDEGRENGERVILIEKYPGTAYFVSKDVFNVAILFDSIGKQRIIAPFTSEGQDTEKINRVIAFLKKHGKMTGYKEYYYLNNYFRLGGIMNNDVEDQGFYMLEKKFYPEGFKDYLIVRAK